MSTFLDLLILVVMLLVAVSLVAMVLMFLVKNRTVKRVCLYLVAALGIYMSYVGLGLLWPNFLGQSIVAALMGLTSIGAVVLERMEKGSGRKRMLAQILASVALLVGMINNFAL